MVERLRVGRRRRWCGPRRWFGFGPEGLVLERLRIRWRRRWCGRGAGSGSAGGPGARTASDPVAAAVVRPAALVRVRAGGPGVRTASGRAAAVRAAAFDARTASGPAGRPRPEAPAGAAAPGVRTASGRAGAAAGRPPPGEGALPRVPGRDPGARSASGQSPGERRLRRRRRPPAWRPRARRRAARTPHPRARRRRPPCVRQASPERDSNREFFTAWRDSPNTHRRLKPPESRRAGRAAPRPGSRRPAKHPLGPRP